MRERMEDDDGEIVPETCESVIRYSADPVRNLWLTVIARAAMDANLCNAKETEIRAKEEARAWFTSRSADLLMVCDLAGVSADKAYQYGVKMFSFKKL